PVEDRLVLVLPVALAHEVAVRRLDVPAPDLVGVVDVGVAVEDREGLGDTVVGARLAARAHGSLLGRLCAWLSSSQRRRRGQPGSYGVRTGRQILVSRRWRAARPAWESITA